MTEWFTVGKIVNTHGIRGEVRIISRTDFPEERYATGSVLYVGADRNSEMRSLTVDSHRSHKQFDLVKFIGFDDLTAVEPLKGLNIYVSEDQLGELGENEYYYHEIVGCDVYTEAEEFLGKVKEILSPGANDVWVVDRKGKKDVLIPYIEDVVKSVNPKEKRIHIHLLEGLIDDEG